MSKCCSWSWYGIIAFDSVLWKILIQGFKPAGILFCFVISFLVHRSTEKNKQVYQCFQSHYNNMIPNNLLHILFSVWRSSCFGQEYAEWLIQKAKIDNNVLCISVNMWLYSSTCLNHTFMKHRKAATPSIFIKARCVETGIFISAALPSWLLLHSSNQLSWQSQFQGLPWRVSSSSLGAVFRAAAGSCSRRLSERCKCLRQQHVVFF